MQEVLKNTKAFRFKLIEKALASVSTEFVNILDEENLGLSKTDLEEFEKLKQKTWSRYEYLNFFANKLVGIYKSRTDEKFWTLYKKSLLEAQEKGLLEYKPKYEQNHIDNAIQNAFYFFFGLYAVLPKIYFQTFRKELDDKTFRILVENSINFAKTMSIIHFDMFRSFIYSSSQTRTGVATMLHKFKPDTFVISDDFEISLSEQALTRAKAHTQKLMQEDKAFIGQEHPTIGCPAKFVTLEDGRDLIELKHQWVLEVMERFIFN